TSDPWAVAPVAGESRLGQRRVRSPSTSGRPRPVLASPRSAERLLARLPTAHGLPEVPFVSLLTPPARQIDPRGQRFGAGVSAVVLVLAFVANLPWLALLVGLNLGLSAAF